MARRRAKRRRAQLRVGLAASMMFVCLYSLSPLGVAQAAPPGSLAASSLGCTPSMSVDIRVSQLATGGAKTNVLRIGWSDGTTSVPAPETVIPQSSYDSMSQSDTYHVDWSSSDPYSSPATPYAVGGTAILSWQWPNGNTKDVASTTAQITCGL
jgi:hypothetical protein